MTGLDCVALLIAGIFFFACVADLILKYGRRRYPTSKR